ncbi:MAG: MBL fold metallo-hydrolase [Deltaproteobacteria bacterium]|jgi:glyoxylase-like metal-dependent hydrolase (beta-lactamase superfamily II)|nr:MBL fold metallo-hydrolase [Deltaproteobacteria bacterium]
MLFLQAALLAAALLSAPGGREALAAEGEGWFTVQYGDLTVTALSDSTGRMPYSLFLPSEISPADFAALAGQAGPEYADSVPSWINAFLVRKGDSLFLVDAGTGTGIADRIRAAGYAPEAVTHVIVTHFHGDHIGGLAAEGGGKAFPNAVLFAPKRDEEYFIPSDGSEVSGTDLARRATAPYRADGTYRPFEPGSQIAPGVNSVSLWGHTPGHSGFRFEGTGGPFLAWGDIVHAYLIQFPRPEATVSYDVDRPSAAETRKRVFNEAADGKLLVAGAHLPFPALGTVSRAQGAGFAWHPYLPPEPAAADGPKPEAGAAPASPEAEAPAADQAK